MKKKIFLSFCFVLLSATIIYAASSTTFKDTSGIGEHTVTIGTSSDSLEPNVLEIYGGGSDCYDDDGKTSSNEHPGAIKLWNGGSTSAAYYLWVDATGDLRIGTTAPGASGFDQEGSGTVVGSQS